LRALLPSAVAITASSCMDEPCPDGWAHGGNGDCLAPQTYAGPCDHVSTFTPGFAGFPWDPPARTKWSRDCEAPWSSCTGISASSLTAQPAAEVPETPPNAATRFVVLRVEVVAHFADWIAQLLEAIEYASSTQRILVVEQHPSNTDAREIDEMLELSTQRFFRASDLQMLSEWQNLSAEDIVHLDGTQPTADAAAVLSHLQSLRLTRDLADDARSIVQESKAVGDTYTAVYLNGRNKPWSCEPSSKPVIDSVYDSIRGLVTDLPCDVQLNGACDAPAYIRHMRQMLHQDANQTEAPVIVLSDQSCLMQLWHEASPCSSSSVHGVCPTEQHLHDNARERILGPAQQFVHFGIMAKANRVVVDHHSPFEIMLRDRSNLKDISMHLAN